MQYKHYHTGTLYSLFRLATDDDCYTYVYRKFSLLVMGISGAYIASATYSLLQGYCFDWWLGTICGLGL